MLITVLVSFFVLLFLGMPISLVIAVSSLLGLLWIGDLSFLSLVTQRMFAGLDNFSILAIPFFFLAGELMSQSKIMDDLVEFALVLVGRVRGGLAHMNVLTSIFFAGITGSAVSDVAAVGPIEVKAMTEGGYDKEFSSALTVASSIIGPIIPPSGVMILYGSIMQVSVAGLFAAGLVPGLIFGLVLMGMSYFYAVRRGYPVTKEPFSIKRVAKAFWNASIALAMPAIILGGIIFGVFTPTEAAAIAAFYALLVGFFIKRSLKIRDLWPILKRVGTSTAAVFLILGASSIFTWLLAFAHVPESIASFFLSITSNKWVLLMLINILLLIVGMFMDNWAALIILAPILGPVAFELGVDPLHFGIVMSINLVIALATPPVGQCLFVASTALNVKIERLWKDLWPMVLAEAGILFLITYVPEIVLFLPRLLGYVQ